MRNTPRNLKQANYDAGKAQVLRESGMAIADLMDQHKQAKPVADILAGCAALAEFRAWRERSGL